MKAKNVGIIGKKLGMTQLYDSKGTLCGVTVVDFSDMNVLGFRTVEKDGYNAVILGYDFKTVKTGNKQREIPKFVSEIRIEDVSPYQEGRYTEILESIDKVDVSGTMKGKGFQGAMKRWHFGGGPASHGSKTHRRPGSIGQNTFPARVFKGKKMPGHMGNQKVTVLSQRLLRVDVERRLLFIEGSVPGSKQSYVTVRDAVKG
ncbi:large subunit ribosomal protein L3 [Brevinema andersonii]|uniref:50S ribosomal protein L3 n=1 Tax=Brevinema andersonii TaxID=34097 RepID=A0A1I1D0N5_BREAD|nr:50S ribosomal protein L3 [Brevinema andersonii]SFB68354.1 large subunit ribosomal protein L3 [Brevinema andersonii]